MPNIAESLANAERNRMLFRAYWKKDTPYKTRKRQKSNAYHATHAAKIREGHIRRRAKLGLISVHDVIKMTGINWLFLQSMYKSGVISPPKRYRDWHCYTVEQVGCLAQGAIYATVDSETSPPFSQERFIEYLRQHWPQLEVSDGNCDNRNGS